MSQEELDALERVALEGMNMEDLCSSCKNENRCNELVNKTIAGEDTKKLMEELSKECPNVKEKI